jgi:hypothetical protein
MNPFLIGLPAFVALTFLGYLLREFAVGKLSAEQLGSLDKRLRPNRIRYVLVAVAMLAVFLAVRFSIPSQVDVWFVTFLSLFALVTLAFESVGWRATVRAELPNSFKTPYLISRVLSIAGVMFLLGAMAATSFVGIEAHPLP